MIQRDGVQSMMKNKQDNNFIDHIGVVYAEIGTELSRQIRQDAVNHENQTEQQSDQS